MSIDNSLILDAGLTLTTTGSSTNYIDTVGAASGQAQISGVNTIQGGYDAYESLFWEVVVLTAFVGAGDLLSIDFQLWTTNQAVSAIWTTGNAGSAPTASVNTIKALSTGQIATSQLTASPNAYTFKARLPVGMQRFIGGFNVVRTTVSAGKMASFLIPDVDINLT